MKNRILFTIMLIIYITIPLLILFIPKLYDLKFYILTILGILIYIAFRLFNIKHEDIGINKNIINSIKRNLSLIMIAIIVIIILKVIGIDRYNPDENIYFYLFYIFISCPIQEFLYRGIFGYFENYLIKNKYLMIIISSMCYSFVHIIYKDFLTLCLTFILGVILYSLYRKDYNLVGVSLSHIIIGILTIALGIVN